MARIGDIVQGIIHTPDGGALRVVDKEAMYFNIDFAIYTCEICGEKLREDDYDEIEIVSKEEE